MIVKSQAPTEAINILHSLKSARSESADCSALIPISLDTQRQLPASASIPPAYFVSLETIP